MRERVAGLPASVANLAPSAPKANGLAGLLVEAPGSLAPRLGDRPPGPLPLLANLGFAVAGAVICLLLLASLSPESSRAPLVSDQVKKRQWVSKQLLIDSGVLLNVRQALN